MKRLITSGCSFTQYYWPTWPWFLSSHFDETYNYAQSGAGNEYIYHSIVEADTDLNFTPADTVIICWSGYTRFDRFKQINKNHSCWLTNGDWYRNRLPRSEFLSDAGWTKKSINYMLATSRYLKSKNVPYKFMSLYDLYEMDDATLSGQIAEIHTNCNFFHKEGLVKWLENLRMNHNPPYVTSNAHPLIFEHNILAQTLTSDPLPHYDIDLLKKYSKFLYNGISKIYIEQLQKTKQYEILTLKRGQQVVPTVEKYGPHVIQAMMTTIDQLTN